jgi:RNA polymerase sigma-70 factor (ECF subfamily)
MAASELERLYDEHASALFAFLLNFTRDEADTRDLLQEIFRRLAARPGLLAGARDERPFLLRLAHNLAVDWVRRRDTRARAVDRLATESEGLFAALAELPADQRLVVHLKLWEGLTFEAIGDVLDLPLNTAASRYRYGLDKLRTRLRPLYEEIR